MGGGGVVWCGGGSGNVISCVSNVKYVSFSGIRDYKSPHALWPSDSGSPLPACILIQGLYTPSCRVVQLLRWCKMVSSSPCITSGLRWELKPHSLRACGQGGRHGGLHCMGKGSSAEGKSQLWAVGLLIPSLCLMPAHGVHALTAKLSPKIRLLCPNFVYCSWPHFSAGLFGVLYRVLAFPCLECESWQNLCQHKMPGFPDPGICPYVWAQRLSQGGSCALLKRDDHQIQRWVGGQVCPSSPIS